MTHNVSAFDLTNFLLGLAWLGELDRQQIGQLWFNDKSESTVQKALTELRKDELIVPRAWSVRNVEKGVTAPQLARWSLTPQGHALIKASDQYPAKPSRPRQRRLIEHDARTIATVVKLILLAQRSGLCGVFLRYEVRLAPDRPRPIADAFVCIQTGATSCAPNIVPWSNDPALADEERRRFVVEGDNATEPAATIRGKGEAYYQLFTDPHWRNAWTAQFGPLPSILWVVPHEARSAVIREQFSVGMHNGTYFLTTDAELERNEWQLVERGTTKRVHIRMLAPALPSPPLPIPPLPVPSQVQMKPPEAGVERPPSANATTSPTLTASSTAPALATPTTPTTTSTAPRATTIRAPTAVDYAAADAWNRAQRWRWWREGVWDAAVWFGQTVWWLCCLLPRGLHALWTWYDSRAYETRSVVWRVLLAVLLVALVWAVMVRPPQFLALARATVTRVGLQVDTRPSISTVAPMPNTAVASLCLQMRVRGTRVNLRAEPGLKGKVVRQLRAGNVVTVLDCSMYEQDGYVWWLVKDDAGGQSGWVAAKWLEETA